MITIEVLEEADRRDICYSWRATYSKCGYFKVFNLFITSLPNLSTCSYDFKFSDHPLLIWKNI